MADDVIGLIDHFGASKAAIVGHDWGAGVAWAVAQKYPERLSNWQYYRFLPLLPGAQPEPAQLLRSWYCSSFTSGRTASGQSVETVSKGSTAFQRKSAEAAAYGC